MPALVQRGTNFWLACQLELDPSDQLYSVKWYRNNEEFYRLILGPADHSAALVGGEQAAGGLQQQYFAQTGVNVMVSHGTGAGAIVLAREETQYAALAGRRRP